MKMNYDHFESGTLDKIELDNHTVYANTSYPTRSMTNGSSIQVLPTAKTWRK